MRETKVIHGFNKDLPAEEVKVRKDNLMKIKKFLLRSTYCVARQKLEDNQNWNDIKNLTFDQFLDRLGMDEEQYLNALQASVRGLYTIIGKRNVKDAFTNNFNVNLMNIHPANHDIQAICDPYAVAQYVAGYLSKAEAGISKLLNKLEKECGNNTSLEKLKKIRNLLDRQREESIQECVWRSLGFPMTKFSHVVKFINTNHPQHRDCMVRPQAELEAMNEEEVNLFLPSPHKYYENRPAAHEDICMAMWSKHFDYFKTPPPGSNKDRLIALQNNMGFVRQRRPGQEAIIRFRIDQQQQIEQARSLCMLFLPYRNEMQDIHEKDVVQLVAENQEAINDRRGQFINSQYASEIMKKMVEEIEQRDLMDDFEDDEEEERPQFNIETTNEEDINKIEKEYEDKARLAIGKEEIMRDMLSLETLLSDIRTLNQQQRKIFDDIIERGASGDIEDDPLYLYIAGDAGTGKSYTVKLIIFALRQVFHQEQRGEEEDKPTVLPMAPTACAARILGGKTYHSAMQLNPTQPRNHVGLTYDRRSRLRFMYENLKFLVMDEVSMLGSNALHKIHLQIGDILEKNHEYMAGLSFLCTGDFQQLPPVGDQPVTEKSKLDGRPSLAASHWDKFKIYYLTEKMRQKDQEFAHLCDRVGVNQLTDNDHAFFNSRIKKSTMEDDNELFKNGKVSILVPTNNKKDQHNSEKLEKLLPNIEEHIILSTDVCKTGSEYFKIPDLVEIPKNKNNQLISVLKIKVGAPVMLTVNHLKAEYREEGIMNGARGYIDFIETVKDHSDKNAPDKVKHIWVKFNDETIGEKYRRDMNSDRKEDFKNLIDDLAVPIKPVRTLFKLTTRNKDSTNIEIEREQFPLQLAYAMTVHKSQGQTLDQVIIDFSPEEGKKRPYISPGLFYVAITRVGSGDRLFLRSYDPSYIMSNTKIEGQIQAMKLQSPYQFFKVNLDEQIFKNNNDTKIGYLNINGLSKQHAEYINEDKNLQNLHLLCLSETKFKTGKQLNLEELMPNWQEKDRFDVNDGKEHMGMIILASKLAPNCPAIKIVDWHKIFGQNNEVEAQVTNIVINELLYSFIYIRQTPTQPVIDEIKDKTKNSAFLIGDLNIDRSEIKKLKSLYGEARTMLLNEQTHRGGKQLDHIIGPKDMSTHALNYFATSFFNFATDHRSITIRVSNDEFDETFLRKPQWQKQATSSSAVKSTDIKEDDIAPVTRESWANRPQSQMKSEDNVQPNKENNTASENDHEKDRGRNLRKRLPSRKRYTSPRPKKFMTENDRATKKDATNVPGPSNQLLILHRSFTNWNSHTCWMNAALQTLSCGLDYLGDDSWNSLYSLMGRQLKTYKRSMHYNNSRTAVQIAATPAGCAYLTNGDQDPEDFFTSIQSENSPWNDIKEIFGHRINVRRQFMTCGHYSVNDQTPSISYRLPLPQRGTNIAEYIEAKTSYVTRLDNHWCDRCYTTGEQAKEKGGRGSLQTTQLMNGRNKNLILIKFHRPLGTNPIHVYIDPDRQITIR
jgi:hypothetical protein